MKIALLLMLAAIPANAGRYIPIGFLCAAGTGGGSLTCPDPISDSFSIGVIAPQSNAAPTDSTLSVLSVASSDANSAPTDAAKAGVNGLGDTNAAPTESKTASVLLWLAAGTQTSNVTNPNNANGSNDSVSSSQQTAAAGATTSSMTKVCAMSATFTSALYRGWFVATIPLPTSNVSIKAHSTSAAYGDITLLSITATQDHSAGDFTFDLFAAGINTSAKLNSTQIQFTTSDSAAGVTPAVLTVDAGRIELGGIF